MTDPSERIASWAGISSILRGSLDGFAEIVRRHARTYLSRRRHAGVMFAPGASADCHCIFEGPNRVWHGSSLSHVRMGRHSYCGVDCRISHCNIARFCSIGPEVVIGLGTHPTNHVSTFPGFYSTIKHTANFHVCPGLIEHRPITIGNDVWIGQRAMILDGITLGDGAIVGAGAVVSKDVAPYAIVGGVPARVIRSRFDDDIVRQLCDLKWWNWDDDLLQEMSHCFDNPRLLLRTFQERKAEMHRSGCGDGSASVESTSYSER